MGRRRSERNAQNPTVRQCAPIGVRSVLRVSMVASDMEVCLAVLASPQPAERAAALLWLGRHLPEAFGAARAPLCVDPVLAMRAAAAVALRGATNPTLVRLARLALRDLMRGADHERRAGLRAAALLANPTLAPRLLPLLSHPDAETRHLTITALAAIPRGWLGTALLRERASTLLADPNAGVRAAAAAWNAQLATDAEAMGESSAIASPTGP